MKDFATCKELVSLITSCPDWKGNSSQDLEALLHSERFAADPALSTHQDGAAVPALSTHQDGAALACFVVGVEWGGEEYFRVDRHMDHICVVSGETHIFDNIQDSFSCCAKIT